MANNIPPTPGGAVPPKPGDSGKVQPKKETVRINLPPKPTAAPTVRLPGPSTGGVAAPTAATAAPASVNVTNVVAPPMTAAAPPSVRSVGTAPAVVATATAASAPRAPAPSTVSRMPVVMGVSGLDKGLALVAAVLGLGVLAHLLIISLG